MAQIKIFHDEAVLHQQHQRDTLEIDMQQGILLATNV
jgi:hypothetical protein